MIEFSVLMSLYIKENPLYLDSCLNSLSEQTLKANEIVVVLDGPITKELNHILIKWEDVLPLRIYPLSKNVGLGEALNYGLDYCKNNTILRMDTDDICLADRFEKQIAYLKENPDVVLLGGAIHEYDASMQISLGIRFSVSEHSDIRQYCKKRNPFNHMTIAFKKDIVEINGGYQHHLFMEDYNLWIRLISAGYQTHNLNCVLVNARAGKDMVLRRRGVNYIKSELKLARLKYDLKIDGFLRATCCALVRILPRLLPLPVLEFLYKKLRK